MTNQVFKYKLHLAFPEYEIKFDCNETMNTAHVEGLTFYNNVNSEAIYISKDGAFLGRAEGVENKTQGQSDYEAELRRHPTYHDGSPRPKWHELSEIARQSWARTPKGWTEVEA